MIDRRVLAAGAMALTATVTLAAKPGERPRVELVDPVVDGGQVVVAFRLTHALDEDAVERIRSGVRVVYRHRLELLARRTMWPSKEHGRIRIETSAVYDALTQRYELSRTTDMGKPKKDRPPAVEERATVDSLDEVRRWMTEFDDLPPLELPADVERQRLRVRVESTLGRHYVMYVFPARVDVSDERKLER